METTGNDENEDREVTVTKTEATEYLGLVEPGTDERTGNLAVIEFAFDRGHYAGPWNEMIVEYAIAQREPGFDVGYDHYDGDLDADLALVAGDAMEYLNESELLPEGYGPDAPHVDDGFGFLTARGEGS
jgi:hypothetical protein